jgi:hypothetical protein
MGDSSSDVMKLRPVTFVYKSEYDPGPRTRQYGLIAEEVAKVYPGLLTYGADGKPYAVKYQYLTPMLLNELQKQHRRLKMDSDLMERQQGEIESLREQGQQREKEFDLTRGFPAWKPWLALGRVLPNETARANCECNTIFYTTYGMIGE